MPRSLNGYRVELEDIERANYLGIRQTIVRLSEGDLAYVVPETQQPVPLYFANRDAFRCRRYVKICNLRERYPLDETVYRKHSPVYRGGVIRRNHQQSVRSAAGVVDATDDA